MADYSALSWVVIGIFYRVIIGLFYRVIMRLFEMVMVELSGPIFIMGDCRALLQLGDYRALLQLRRVERICLSAPELSEDLLWGKYRALS